MSDGQLGELVTQSVGTSACARLFKCVHTFKDCGAMRVTVSRYGAHVKVLYKTQPVKPGQERLGAFGTRGKVDKVYQGYIFFKRKQAGRGRRNRRNGGAGRRTFQAGHVGSAR